MATKFASGFAALILLGGGAYIIGSLSRDSEPIEACRELYSQYEATRESRNREIIKNARRQYLECYYKHSYGAED
ncbi:unnamed protein product [Blepharisma stoltei]|uniref:Uncharacterized protein n=1 Tax=Blepharisma stoltei TaxID=1481888 RepID=A0AAU9K2E8_9CILI|nr:unnamed protein product [Blepharisma stoltei]